MLPDTNGIITAVVGDAMKGAGTAVMIPIAVVDLHEPNPGLGHATREETFAAEVPRPRFVASLSFFPDPTSIRRAMIH